MTKRMIAALIAGTAVLTLPATQADASGQGASRTTTLTFNERIGGTNGGEVVRGRTDVSVPRAWQRLDRQSATPLLLRADGACAPHVRLDTRATATRSDATAQVRRSTRFGTAAIDEGGTSTLAWRVVETPQVDGRRGIYGVAAIRVARHRWLHLRAIVTLARSCETQYSADSDLISTIVRYLSTRPEQVAVRDAPRR